MNPLQIYKLLPKTNCGMCLQKLCMPFAFAVSKGESDVSECPLIKEKDLQHIKSNLVTLDWHLETINRLKKEVGDLQFHKIADRIGAYLKDSSLVIKSLNREITIFANGDIKDENSLSLWMRILLLSYLKKGGNCDLVNRWVSFSELKNGFIKASTFKTQCEDFLNQVCDSNNEIIDEIFQKLGSTTETEELAKKGWIIHPLPKIPLLVLYWQRDDSFDSQTKILFDSSADCYLDIESLIFLTEEMINEVVRAIEREKIS
ncbi:MAG: DUF3786 domain-containing protein [Thermodesulfovibrionales bacterium]|nr:DUF3786 domain-containing protein [Thermodesulfovibrionales bacterium]